MTRAEQLAANRRLAELTGWSGIVDVGGALLGTPPRGQAACRGQAAVPDWSGDWRACGPLLSEHLIDVGHLRTLVAAASPQGCRTAGVSTNRDAATRAVIVAAVIAKLGGA
jgi:hypothetical protein